MGARAGARAARPRQAGRLRLAARGAAAPTPPGALPSGGRGALGDRVRGRRRAGVRRSGTPVRAGGLRRTCPPGARALLPRLAVSPVCAPARGPRPAAPGAPRCTHLAHSTLQGAGPRDTRQRREAFVASGSEGDVTVIQGVEAGAAAEPPAGQRTAPHHPTPASPKCPRYGGVGWGGPAERPGRAEAGLQPPPAQVPGSLGSTLFSPA